MNNLDTCIEHYIKKMKLLNYILNDEQTKEYQKGILDRCKAFLNLSKMLHLFNRKEFGNFIKKKTRKESMIPSLPPSSLNIVSIEESKSNELNEPNEIKINSVIFF